MRRFLAKQCTLLRFQLELELFFFFFYSPLTKCKFDIWESGKTIIAYDILVVKRSIRSVFDLAEITGGDSEKEAEQHTTV